MFIRDGLDFVRLGDVEAVFQPSVFCKIFLSGAEEIVVGVIYRSPNCTQGENDDVLKLIETAVCKAVDSRLVMMGDFNYPEIDWQKDSCKSGPNHPARKFLSTIQENSLTQHVTEPTHFRAMQNPTLIDLVFTREDERDVHSMEHLAPLGKSHHVLQSFKIGIAPTKDNTRFTEKYIMSNGDFDAMRGFLGEVDWCSISSVDLTIDDNWKFIKDKIEYAMGRYIPRKTFPIGSKQTKRMSVPEPMHNKIRNKRKAFKRFKEFKTVENHKVYAKARNQVKWESRKLVKAREAKLAVDVKSNPKSFYRYVSSKTKPKESVLNLIKADGTWTRRVIWRKPRC